MRELAKRTGLTETGAITEAVQARLAELDRDSGGNDHRRDARRRDAQRLLGELHNSLTESERKKLRAADKQLYDDAGLPS